MTLSDIWCRMNKSICQIKQMWIYFIQSSQWKKIYILKLRALHCGIEYSSQWAIWLATAAAHLCFHCRAQYSSGLKRSASDSSWDIMTTDVFVLWVQQMDSIWGAILHRCWGDRCTFGLDLWIATCFCMIFICQRHVHTLCKAKLSTSTSSTRSVSDLERLFFILLNIYRHTAADTHVV